VDPGPARQRCVLAALAVEMGRPVPIPALIDRVWDGRPPQRARHTLQVYLSRIRGTLAEADPSVRISRRSGGYALEIGDGRIDMARVQPSWPASSNAGPPPPFAGVDSNGRSAPVDAPKQLAHLLPALWRGVYDATKGSEDMPALESQVQILRKLVASGELSSARLAEELRLARPTVSNSLRGLVADGLVQRERSTADGRSVLLQATTRGQDVLYAFRQGRADVLAEVLAELPADDQSRLLAALPSLDLLLERLEARADAEWNVRRQA
jgi:DNA-binding MarR family transcriptional regulator